MGDRLAIVMENLDLGNYFFAGHPRERVGIEEKQKFFVFQFILFVIGFTNAEIRKYKKFLFCVSGALLIAVFLFKWRTFDQTIFASIPLILIMALGFRKVLSWSKKWQLALVVFSLVEIVLFSVYLGIF